MPGFDVPSPLRKVLGLLKRLPISFAIVGRYEPGEVGIEMQGKDTYLFRVECPGLPQLQVEADDLEKISQHIHKVLDENLLAVELMGEEAVFPLEAGLGLPLLGSNPSPVKGLDSDYFNLDVDFKTVYLVPGSEVVSGASVAIKGLVNVNFQTRNLTSLVKLFQKLESVGGLSPLFSTYGVTPGQLRAALTEAEDKNYGRN